MDYLLEWFRLWVIEQNKATNALHLGTCKNLYPDIVYAQLILTNLNCDTKIDHPAITLPFLIFSFTCLPVCRIASTAHRYGKSLLCFHHSSPVGIPIK